MQSKHPFINALLRKPVDYTPVWIMRQAGRYLPEYRALRQKAQGFLKLCKTPEWAAEATLQPLDRYPLDAGIIFSDILTIPDAFQMGLYFSEGEGPRFERPIRTVEDIRQLPTVDPEDELRYVMDAIRLTQQTLQDRVPLIGFSGSPWTLATYMIEGQSSKTFSKIKAWLYRDPAALHLLLKHLAKTVIQYLNAQIKAGVNAIMLFDTWGGVLGPLEYQMFSLHYMTEIAQNVLKTHEGKPIPLIIFTKGGGFWLDKMAETGCEALGLDWTVNLSQAREQVGNRVALQGNLDPSVLYGERPIIEQQVQRILGEFGFGSGHVFNLGHGIHPEIDPDHVGLLIEAVHTFSRQYHQRDLECH